MARWLAANIACSPSLTSPEKSSSAPKIVSNWSSRSVTLVDIFLKDSMALNLTSWISSLNMSTMKSSEILAILGCSNDRVQSALTAAVLTWNKIYLQELIWQNKYQIYRTLSRYNVNLNLIEITVDKDTLVKIIFLINVEKLRKNYRKINKLEHFWRNIEDIGKKFLCRKYKKIRFYKNFNFFFILSLKFSEEFRVIKIYHEKYRKIPILILIMLSYFLRIIISL